MENCITNEWIHKGFAKRSRRFQGYGKLSGKSEKRNYLKKSSVCPIPSNNIFWRKKQNVSTVYLECLQENSLTQQQSSYNESTHSESWQRKPNFIYNLLLIHTDYQWPSSTFKCSLIKARVWRSFIYTIYSPLPVYKTYSRQLTTKMYNILLPKNTSQLYNNWKMS